MSIVEWILTIYGLGCLIFVAVVLLHLWFDKDDDYWENDGPFGRLEYHPTGRRKHYH
jgi:hypothetical protein